ncbi:tetratricopeptide repeat protein [Tessaracoccus defluvii]|uniref:Tetratricopeptide repeat protein n=1 Tax=Tessaracoccus defluvii TaxID=1285901 RepID=A0A7H0H2T2_9ACTN|nr:hypothetical protein [Tessaracoccus defluvii]QNP54848.1 hypothetical protein H9L22_11105 [Tessaracoccus defluvii]
MTTPDPTVEAALERVKQLDRAGDLDGAKEEVERLRLELQPTATVQIRSRLLRVGARVLRHRHERASLRNAGNAAGSALAISQAAPTPNGTAVTLASLEVAACELASGDVDAAIRRVEGVRDHPDPAISGWAHLIVGRSRLAQGRHFPAIASMHNAIAEFQRHGHAHRTAAARLWLAVALDDAGRVEEAHRALTEDRAVWTGDAPVRRVSILHRLTSAANARSRGEIGSRFACSPRRGSSSTAPQACAWNGRGCIGFGPSVTGSGDSSDGPTLSWPLRTRPNLLISRLRGPGPVCRSHPCHRHRSLWVPQMSPRGRTRRSASTTRCWRHWTA